MQPSPTKSLKETLSEINPRDLVYPGIILGFIVIICILFYIATQFLTKSINNALSSDGVGSTNSLNIGNYTLVAKKLGISLESIVDEQTTPATPVESTTTVATTTVTIETPSKDSLTINILNATRLKGIAGTLSSALETAGFAKATVGNNKKLQTETTITIKESVYSIAPIVLAEVQKSYPDATTATTTDDADFDIKIVIGSK